MLRDELEPIHFTAGRLYRRSLFFAHLAPTDLVQTQIRHNSVQPSTEAAVKAECGQLAKDAEESFLVNVTRIFLRMKEIERHSQHALVIGADQLFERLSVAALSGAT